MLIFIQIIQIYLNVTCNVKINTLLQGMLKEITLSHHFYSQVYQALPSSTLLGSHDDASL